MAGFFKRMFSFGRDDRRDASTEVAPEPADAPPSGRPDETPPEPVPAPPSVPSDDGPGERAPVRAEQPSTEQPSTERPPDADGADEPATASDATPPDADDDPAGETDPAPTPVPPSHTVGGTADRHAHSDAIALEETGEPPVEGGAPEAGIADPERDGADGTAPSHEDASDTDATDEDTRDEDTRDEDARDEDARDGNAADGSDAGREPEASDTPSEPATPHPTAPAPLPRTASPPRGGTFSTATLFDERPDRTAPAPAPEPEAPSGFLARLRRGLGRSSQELTRSIASVFRGRRLDDEALEELEDVLLRADLGTAATDRIVERLAERARGREVGEDEVRTILAAEVERLLAPVAEPLELDLDHKPHVILVVGVNGTGKTTTIGKLAAKLRRGGLQVMLAAGDTFRAAAIEQLHLWGERVGAEVVSSKLGADAAGLAFGAYERAREAGADVLLIDTAGRLQNRAELMEELAKVVRVLRKHDPSAPHTVLQTLDATTGQNALSQVEAFRDTAGVGGLVMTKLDGTARGGVLVAVAARFGLPVWFVGVGEGVDDLEPFRADEFARAIAGAETNGKPSADVAVNA